MGACSGPVATLGLAIVCVAMSCDLAVADATARTDVSVALLPLAQAAPASAPSSQPVGLKDDPRYQRWRVTITWSLVILIAFVTAASAIVVFSRRFRRWLGREETKPTSSEDVWAMHKAPENPPDLEPDDDEARED